MIVYEDGAMIENPSEVLDYRDFELEDLQKAESSSKLSFFVPEKFKTNTEKAVYKTGFLSEFLRKVYPQKKPEDIYKIMNNRYHLFSARRTMERKIKAYLENEKYH